MCHLVCQDNSLVQNVEQSPVEFGIITLVRVHIRTLEEVNTDCRRMSSVSLDLTGSVNGFSVVTITKSASYVATHIVILCITKVRVNPLAEIGTGKGIG